MSKRIKDELWARHGVKPQTDWATERDRRVNEKLQTPEAWARVWAEDAR